MNTPLTKGGTVHGFTILDIVDLRELDAAGIHARHVKTGAEVFHIVNDDSENTFAFAFKTLPEDSSGVFHIIEHSTLCGSERFPLKDAFIVLAQGSLQTFLNAWTFPDKTVYPASSTHEGDYFNLMSVYADAVMRPRLAEWTFMQEGQRVEFKKNDDGTTDENRLSINGVVYNEMMGAYSALDEFAGQWSIKSVLEGSLYGFDSGGDPQAIPRLTYEEFRRFYKQYYSPANTQVFLCGNIPTEKQLAFLDTNVFAGMEPGQKAPAIPRVERWNAPRRLCVRAPASGDNTLTVFVSWLCNEIDFRRDPDAGYRALVFDVLCELLLGHDGSPLAKALVTSGLGEDLANVCGLEDEIKFHVLTVGLRGVKSEKKAAKIEKCILKELRRLCKKGIPRATLEAALFAEEFSEREIKRADSGPWALVLLRRSLRGWLHGEAPWKTLCVKDDFQRLKNELAANSRYFEDFIQKELLDNPHRALVSVQPDPSFSAEREREKAAYLAALEADLTEDKKQAIREKSAELERAQTTPDAPETAALIPHILVKDLDGAITRVPRELFDAGGVPVLSHRLKTNGISYCSIAFPVDTLPFDDYIYLPFFTNCVNAMGVKGKDWAAVSGELARVTAGFYASLHTSPAGFGARAAATPSGILPVGGRDWIVLSFKTLDEKLDSALALITTLFREADFSDTRRLRTLILETRNSALASLAPAGSALALLRAARESSRAAALGELWHGVTQLDFTNRLPKTGIRETARRLSSIRDALCARSGPVVNITGEYERESLSLLQKYLAPFGPVNPPREETRKAGEAGAAGEAVEVFASESLQTGFLGMSMASSPPGTVEAAAEEILSHYLSTGSLWENLRMQCGAYGASCAAHTLRGIVTFSTYRDPNPALSRSVMPEILQKIARAPVAREELEKTITGVYSKVKQPFPPGKKGALDFSRFLDGIDDTFRQRNLDALLSVDAAAFENAAKTFAERITLARTCVVSGAKDAEKAAASYGVPARKLPV